jgi:hypothetical protein
MRRIIVAALLITAVAACKKEPEPQAPVEPIQPEVVTPPVDPVTPPVGGDTTAVQVDSATGTDSAAAPQP